jgi:hypothetical protein
MAFYYPPGHVPPGPPPNYNQIDSSYFAGEPALPVPPPDSGGYYIWWAEGRWTIASHIYSKGNSLEQFHGSILAVMEQQPQLNVNVFIRDFELWGDTTHNRCLLQNDRWGWVQWDDNLYEIWWDVTTRELKTTGQDLNDFIEVSIAGCAIDFNLWSSAHGGLFGPDQVYLGQSITPLSDIPEYSDTFVGITDPYQSQAGNDPTSDPNITVFTRKSLPGASYNRDGRIDSLETHPCDPDYGLRYAGAFAYEGNGIEFSTLCRPRENEPPTVEFPSGTTDTTFFVCVGDSICLEVVASDPDPGDTVTLTLLQGPVVYPPRTAPTLIIDTVCFFPETTGVYQFVWRVTDNHGAFAEDTTGIVVTLNTPPVIVAPPDVDTAMCRVDSICVDGIYAYDVDSLETGPPTLALIDGPGVYDAEMRTLCFLPDDSGGTYRFIFEACDICLEPFVPGGAMLAATPLPNFCPQETLYVTVDLNRLPFIVPPPPPEPIVCVPEDHKVCIGGWQVGDPDGDHLVFSTMGSGTFDSATGTFCTMVSAPGEYTQTLVVSDLCGETVRATLTFQVLGNTAPIVIITAPDSVTQCEIDTICADFTATDAEGSALEIVANLGEVKDGSACFVPDTSGVYTLIITAADECGTVGTDTAQITVTLNNPPFVDAPDTTSASICEGIEFICLSEPVIFGDPDAGDSLTLILPPGATYDAETHLLCVPPVEAGLHDFVVRVTDECGATVYDTITVEVLVNTPPVITFSVPDTTINVCDPDTFLCFTVSASDAAGHPVTIEEILNPGFFNAETGEFCFNPDSICFDHPSTVDTTICVIFRATGECGSTVDSLCIHVVSDSPPVVSLPNDTSLTLCEPGRVCVGSAFISDPDGDSFSVTVSDFAALEEELICFDADTSGVYAVVVCATDPCGRTACDTIQITVEINAPPVVILPADYSVKLCSPEEVGPEQVCVTPVEISDPDGDSVTITVVGASQVDSQFCFVAGTAGPYQVIVTATDECGLSASDTINITVEFNSPPQIMIRNPDPLLLCDVDTVICYPIMVSDMDGRYGITLETIKCDPAIWSIVGNTLCLNVAVALEGKDSVRCGAVVQAEDSCGAKDRDTIQVIIVRNQAPVVELPDDMTVTLCEPQQICVPFEYSDPNGETLEVSVTGGALSGDSICFFADRDTVVTLTMTVTDSCGLQAADSVNVTVQMGAPPVVVMPSFVSLPLCRLDTICLAGIGGKEVDGTPLPAELISGQGVFNPESGVLCFLPEAYGAFEFTFVVHGACGDDTGELTILVTENDAPVFDEIPDTTIVSCEPVDTVCLQFHATDPDDEPIVYSLISGHGAIDTATGRACFVPGESGEYGFIVTAHDRCGNAAVDTGFASVQFNTPPELHFSVNDTTVFVCDPDTFLCFTVTATDADGETPTIREILNPGFFDQETGEFCFNPDSVCFDHPETVDTTICVIFAATDSCGAEVVDSLCIHVVSGRPPVLEFSSSDTTIYLCDPDTFLCFTVSASDPDGGLPTIREILNPGFFDAETGEFCFNPDSVCFDNPGTVDTTICVIFAATDTCGLEDVDTLCVHVVTNRPPVVDLGPDTATTICAPLVFCLDLAGRISDPDGDAVDITATLPAYIDTETGAVCIEIAASGTYEIIVCAADSCGAQGCDTLVIDAVVNRPPEVTLPADTGVALCSLQTVCVGPVAVSDPDLGDSVTVIVTGGAALVDGQLCFTPTETGVYTFVVTATDACGLSDADTVNVTVDLNAPPELQFSSNDTTIFMCGPDTLLCFTVSASDPDGGTPTIREILNPGFFDAETGEFCFNPDSVCFDNPGTIDTTICVIFAATDECGVEDVDTLCVHVITNRPPTVELGPDDTLSLCGPTLFCVNLEGRVSDPDGDALDITVVLPAYHDVEATDACIQIDSSGVYEIIVCATDSCGAQACDTVLVHAELNNPPTVTLPADTTVTGCVVGSICVGPVTVTDPDGDSVQVFVTGGAVLSDGQLCFTPESSGVYTFIVTAVDACNASDADTLAVTVDVQNQPPTLSFSSPDTTIMLCDPDTELCFIVTAGDPDGGEVVIDEILNPGSFNPLTGVFCFNPDSVCFDGLTSDTTICVIFRVTDDCGLSTTDSLCVTVILNKPPELHFDVPDSAILLCNTDTVLCFGISATDPEGDAVVITEILNPGAFYPEAGLFCFNPDSICFGGLMGDTTVCVLFKATDVCGNTKIDSGCIHLMVNSSPVVTGPDSADIVVCTLGEEVCIEGVAAIDREDGSPPLVVNGAVYHAAEQMLCFVADTVGTYVISLSSADFCGSLVSRIISVDVALNTPPVLQLPPDAAVLLCQPDTQCFDFTLGDLEGAIVITEITGGAYYDSASAQLCVPVLSDENPITVSLTVVDSCGETASDTFVVTPTLSTPPSITLPPDFTDRMCTPGDYCFGPIVVNDPDGDWDGQIVVQGGVYDTATGEICITTPTAGAHMIIASVTDSCAESDADTVVITLEGNAPPVTQFSVPDTSMFLCNPDTILCFVFSATDPDGDAVVLNDILNPGTFDPETGEFCFNPLDVCFTDPEMLDTILCLIFAAGDECGAVTYDSVCIALTANAPPVVTLPPDDTVSTCTSDSICIGPIVTSDPNGTDDTVEVSVSGPGHKFDTATGTICFLGSEGVYEFIVTATDRCGATDVDTVQVIVNGNTEPVVTLPANFTQNVCSSASVCFPVTVVDPDFGDSVVVTVVSGPGSYNPATGQVCFTAAANGIVTIVVQGTDECGASDRDTIDITIVVNDKPFFTQAPQIDTSVCTVPAQICFEIIAADPNGDAVKYYLVSGPGNIDSINGILCFVPAAGSQVYQFVVEARDACGGSIRDTATVDVQVDRPPVFTPPRDTILSQCAPTQICFPPFAATDPDGDALTYELLSSKGTITGTMLCFTPDTPGVAIYCFTVRARDACGKSDTVSFCAQVTLNGAPQITLPADMVVEQCAPGPVCFNNVLVSDPNGDVLTVTKVIGPGTYNPSTGEICFDPGSSGGTFFFIMRVIDPCGLDDRDTINVTVNVNRAPSLLVPTTVAACVDSMLCIDVQGNDPDDGDILTIVQTSGPAGTLSPNPINGPAPVAGQWCWTPTGLGEFLAVFRVTDQCGETSYDTTRIVVDAFCDSLCFASDIEVICPSDTNSNMWLFQGRTYEFSVNTVVGRPVGGFDLLIGFDATALTLVGVSRGSGVSAWEFFNYSIVDPASTCEGPCPSGLVRIVAIADLNNGHPISDPSQMQPGGGAREFAKLSFQVSNDRTLAGQFIPVQFWWNDCGDNAFSSPEGVLYVADIINPDTCVDGGKTAIEACATFSNGGGCIPRPGDIDDLGDINLNGLPYEVADAVLYTNYFIYGSSVLDPNPIYRESQIAASDVNGDGAPLTVADLVFLIRVIVGLEEPLGGDGTLRLSTGGQGRLELRASDGGTEFVLDASEPVGGVASQLQVDGAVQTITAADVLIAAGMELAWHQDGATVRVLIHSAKAATLDAGIQSLFTVSGDVRVLDVKADASSGDGRVMKVEVSGSAIQPEAFTLEQNYPNPFNPETEIRFQIGADATVSLVIYNLLGQPVSTLVHGQRLGAGEYSYKWDARGHDGSVMPSGVYLYMLQVNDKSESKKMLLLR